MSGEGEEKKAVYFFFGFRMVGARLTAYETGQEGCSKEDLTSGRSVARGKVMHVSRVFKDPRSMLPVQRGT